MKAAKAIAVLFFLGASFTAPANAERMSLGEFEYLNSCAQCHGKDGKGGGPVATYLRGLTPDLTILQKNNDGVFPVKRLYSVIEGTEKIAVHGSEMLLWGNRYRERTQEHPDDHFSPQETELYVAIRILALIEYLATIQNK